MKIKDMFQRFKYNRLRNHVGGLNPHNAVIGEWIRWWVEDSQEPSDNRDRMVIEPPPYVQRRQADILFLEKDPRSPKAYPRYLVKGVAEIENKKEKLVDKIDTLRKYERATEEIEWEDSDGSTGTATEQQYPDLKFGLLCSIIYPNTRDVDEVPELRNAIDKAKEYSNDSRMTWIIYVNSFQNPP